MHVTVCLRRSIVVIAILRSLLSLRPSEGKNHQNDYVPEVGTVVSIYIHDLYTTMTCVYDFGSVRWLACIFCSVSPVFDLMTGRFWIIGFGVFFGSNFKLEKYSRGYIPPLKKLRFFFNFNYNTKAWLINRCERTRGFMVFSLLLEFGVTHAIVRIAPNS